MVAYQENQALRVENGANACPIDKVSFLTRVDLTTFSQQMIDRRIQRHLGRQKQRLIKRLRRAKEVREAEERQIAMKLEQANQVRIGSIIARNNECYHPGGSSSAYCVISHSPEAQ